MIVFVRRFANWLVACTAGLNVAITGYVEEFFFRPFKRLGFEFAIVFALGVAGSIAVHCAGHIMQRLPWRGITIALLLSNVVMHFIWFDAGWNTHSRIVILFVGATFVSLFITLNFGYFSLLRKLLSFHAFGVLAISSHTLYLIHAQLLAIVWKVVIFPLKLSHLKQLVLAWGVVVPLIVTLPLALSRFMEKLFCWERSNCSGEESNDYFALELSIAMWFGSASITKS